MPWRSRGAGLKEKAAANGDWTKYFVLRDGDRYKTEDPKEAVQISSKHHLALTEGHWEKIGNYLSKATKLKDLHLHDCGISNVQIMILLFGEDQQCSYPLKVFTSIGNRFGPRGLEVALPYLQTIPTLRFLGLDGANLGREGVLLLSDALKQMDLTTLKLRENNIGDDAVETLLSVDNCRQLKSLSLHRNGIGKRGFDSITQFLRRDGTMLQRLYIADNKPMDEDCAKNFVDLLPKESELETLSFGSADLEDTRDKALAAVPNLEKLVCDTSSFEAICQSNHNLRAIGVKENEPTLTLTKLGRKMVRRSPILRQALEINARNAASNNEKLRSKLKTFYFKGPFDVQPFTDMDIKLMPNVLEFVTMSVVSIDGTYVKACKGDLDGIYRLIHDLNLPGLISSTPPQEVELQDYKSKISAMEIELERLLRENEMLSSKICTCQQMIVWVGTGIRHGRNMW